MEREKIICIFCGRIAKIKEQDGLKIVVGVGYAVFWMVKKLI